MNIEAVKPRSASSGNHLLPIKMMADDCLDPHVYRKTAEKSNPCKLGIALFVLWG